MVKQDDVQPKKECHLCAQPIPASARVCFHCQMHQGFLRRNTAFGVSLLSLLVALAAIGNSALQTFSTAVVGDVPRISLATPEVRNGLKSGFGGDAADRFELVIPILNDGNEIVMIDPQLDCMSGEGMASRGVPGPNFLTLRRDGTTRLEPKNADDIIWTIGHWAQLDVSSGGFYAGDLSAEFYDEIVAILSELYDAAVSDGPRRRMTVEFSCLLMARTFGGELAHRTFTLRVQYQRTDVSDVSTGSWRIFAKS